MKQLTTLALVFAAIGWSTMAQAIPINITAAKLTGLTGGSPANTAVYRADLDSLGIADLASITIRDNSSGLGGATGQFSGFDLDAIILSGTYCADAGCVAGLAGLAVFDYSPASTLFTMGSQRPPSDPRLFGTDASGTNVDDSVATLGIFDGNSTTAIPGADGFLSMGDNGTISFNLTSLVSTTDLYMYFGEVGDNGEVAASSIEISDKPVTVPAPASLALMGLGLVGLIAFRRRRFG